MKVSTAAVPMATALTASTVTRIRFCGIRSAATPPISTAPTRPTLAPVATRDRSAGPPPSAITCQTTATSQTPAPSSDISNAIVRMRY